MTYRYNVEVRGLETVQTVKWKLEESKNPRAKAFDMLSYSRLNADARAYLREYVDATVPGA